MDRQTETGENCALWNHRSLAPPGPLPKRRRRMRKFPMCESIGHQPLWGRCPKKDKQNLVIYSLRKKCNFGLLITKTVEIYQLY